MRTKNPLSSRDLSSIDEFELHPQNAAAFRYENLTRHPRAILIIGRSVSLLAKAARSAGFEPLVLDAYGDCDTLEVAAEYRPLRFSGASIDATSLYTELARLDDTYGRTPLYWGAGWEAAGHLLQALAYRYPLLGSAPQALLSLAQPSWGASSGAASFIGGVFSSVVPPGTTLIKDRMRAGGHAVRFAGAEKFLAARQFRQPYLAGISASVLCAAHANGVEILGFSEHFALQPSKRHPFRHSAAIATPPLPGIDELRRTLTPLAQRLNLHGLFGVDFLRRENGALTIVDINPRPTATAPLHLDLTDVFRLHVKPSLSRGLKQRRSLKIKADAVVYADTPIEVPKRLNWPTWVSDIPSESGVFSDGQPLCSIYAAADTTDEAKQLLNARLDELLALFQTEQ